ncbi:hypothetical protein E2C01_007674 [Portunus trituberculatus]|uniref:Uncharacterized protein n=1 Tax=Portunus trituberculatus TaxID=210409 RepID=A0A5B7D307_PORTR|nr:hypothetical protein [Portunus trituberculatus]
MDQTLSSSWKNFEACEGEEEHVRGGTDGTAVESASSFRGLAILVGRQDAPPSSRHLCRHRRLPLLPALFVALLQGIYSTYTAHKIFPHQH